MNKSSAFLSAFNEICISHPPSASDYCDTYRTDALKHYDHDGWFQSCGTRWGIYMLWTWLPAHIVLKSKVFFSVSGITEIVWLTLPDCELDLILSHVTMDTPPVQYVCHCNCRLYLSSVSLCECCVLLWLSTFFNKSARRWRCVCGNSFHVYIKKRAYSLMGIEANPHEGNATEYVAFLLENWLKSSSK